MSVEELRRHLAIDEGEVKLRKSFFILKKEDEELLKKIGEVLDRHADEILEKFYEHLLSFPETKAYFKDKETINRVKGYQKAYFKRLTKGNYDLKYFEERLKIGIAHDRITLPVKFYIGAYDKCYDLVMPKICKELGYKDCEATLPVAAFSKIMFLDLSLAIDAYVAAREKRIKESEEKFRNLVENSNDCIGLLDLDGKILYMNPAGMKMHTLSAREIESMQCTKLVKKGYEGLINTSIEEAKNGKIVRYRYESSLGIWFDSVLSPVRDYKGEVVSLIKVSRDITEMKKAEEQLKEHSKELAILNAVSEVAAKSLAINEILSGSLKKALELTGIDAGEIYLLDEGKGELVHTAYHGLSEEFVKESRGKRLKLGEGIPGEAAKTGVPYISEDINKDPKFVRMVAKKEGYHSFISVPLKSKEKVLGTINLINRAVYKFTPERVEMLISIANIIAVASENAKLYELTKSARQKLEERVKELEEFHRITVGRELKMIELEKKVEELEAKLKEIGKEEGKTKNARDARNNISH